jgi:hypothetical protein
MDLVSILTIALECENALQEKFAPLQHELEMCKMDHETQLDTMELGDTDERKDRYADLASPARGRQRQARCPCRQREPHERRTAPIPAAARRAEPRVHDAGIVARRRRAAGEYTQELARALEEWASAMPKT